MKEGFRTVGALSLHDRFATLTFSAIYRPFGYGQNHSDASSHDSGVSRGDFAESRRPRCVHPNTCSRARHIHGEVPMRPFADNSGQRQQHSVDCRSTPSPSGSARECVGRSSLRRGVSGRTEHSWPDRFARSLHYFRLRVVVARLSLAARPANTINNILRHLRPHHGLRVGRFSIGRFGVRQQRQRWSSHQRAITGRRG